MRYGFIEPKLDSTQYIMGAATSLTRDILQADGQWDKYLPQYEAQADLYETNGCTVWGTENAIEILEKKIFGGEPNYDERFPYNMVPIRPPGGDPHAVAEKIRKHGLIPNRPLPPTFEEFCRPTPPSAEEYREGSKWLDKWEFGHEWVPTDKSSLKQALRYSPLAVSVSAWFKEDGMYVDLGIPNNHWCVIYGYTEANGKTFWKVFDSYDHSLKVLHPDHKIGYAKRYSLKPVQKKENWLINLIKYVLGITKAKTKVPDVVVANIKSPRERLYDAAVASLGIDASPNDIAPDEFGCAETINEIHKKAFGDYIETPGISTTKLFAALVDRADKFVRVTDPDPGNIIISPTGFSTHYNPPIKNGHVGIFGQNQVILSNSSTTGKFEENYTLETWIDRYRKRGKYPIYYFKRI